MLIPSSFRGLAPCALSLAILLSAVSCAPENPMRQAAVPAPPRPELRTPGDVFREGEDTAGVRHVLAVMLAYLIRRELSQAWQGLNVTVEEGLAQLEIGRASCRERV